MLDVDLLSISINVSDMLANVGQLFAEVCQVLPRFAKVCQGLPRFAKFCQGLTRFDKFDQI